MVIVAESDEECNFLQDFFTDNQTAGIFHEKIPVNTFSIIQLPQGELDSLLMIARFTGMYDRRVKKLIKIKKRLDIITG
jgi:hypothetical protein